MQVIPEQKKWKQVITPGSSLLSLRLKELWEYRDLLFILTRRDILAIYKQTILGPLWFVLQPVLTTITFIIIFARAGKYSTDGIPPVLFYLSGLVMWSYFSECIVRTATFFKDNTQILTKVYFPRLIIPLSLILTNFIKFAIQITLFVLVYAWYYFTQPESHIVPTAFIALLPVLILLTGILGFGMGLLISSLTTRYKDLIHLLTFGVQLLMFMSPVIFPVTSIGNNTLKTIIKANPMSGIIEAFRYGFMGKGYFNWSLLTYDAACVCFFLLLGIVVFNSVEKNFADTI